MCYTFENVLGKHLVLLVSIHRYGEHLLDGVGLSFKKK